MQIIISGLRHAVPLVPLRAAGILYPKTDRDKDRSGARLRRKYDVYVCLGAPNTIAARDEPSAVRHLHRCMPRALIPVTAGSQAFDANVAVRFEVNSLRVSLSATAAVDHSDLEPWL